MKFCSNCGNQMDDNAVVCTKCGCAANNQPAAPAVNDAPNTGITVLGFFFPIIGLILYLMWNDTQPLKAKSAGKGAFIGFITRAALFLISIIFSVIFSFAMFAPFL